MQSHEIRTQLPVWVIDAAYKAGIKLRNTTLVKITPKTAVLEQNGEPTTVYKRNAWK